MSTAYREFVKRYLKSSGLDRKDGPPLHLLDKLTEEEKKRAEDKLIRRLKITDDWASVGLGHLKSTKALPALYKLLSKSWGIVKAETATAIWKICEDIKMLQIVINLSKPSFLSRLNPFHEFKQIDIIYCLVQFPQPEAKRRLQELAEDEKYLIAYNAKRALSLRHSYYKIND